MICKWCGTTIDPKQTRCSGCGRPIPANTDCGGFFNVVRLAQNSPAQGAPAQQSPQQPPQQPQKQDAAEKKRAPRVPWLLLLIVPVLLAAVLAFLLLGMQKRFGTLEAQHAELKTATEQLERSLAEQADEIKADVAALERPSFPGKSDETEPTEAVEEAPELRFDVRTDLSETGILAENYDGSLTVRYDEQDGLLRWTCLAEGRRLWTAELERQSESVTMPEDPNDQVQKEPQEIDMTGLTLRCELASQYLEQYGEPTLTWEYRADDRSDWESFDTLEPESCQVREDGLLLGSDWIGERKEQTEFRCTVLWTGKEGGSLTLSLSGALLPLLQGPADTEP